MDVILLGWHNGYDTEALWDIYWGYKLILTDLDRYQNTAILHLGAAVRGTLREIENELTRRAEQQIKQGVEQVWGRDRGSIPVPQRSIQV